MINSDQNQSGGAIAQRPETRVGVGVAGAVTGAVQAQGGTVAQEPKPETLSHPRIRAAVAALGLTQRESQIVEKFSHGMSTQALAAELFISAATVRTHLRKIFTKLDINSRVELLSLVLAKVMEDLDGSGTS